MHLDHHLLEICKKGIFTRTGNDKSPKFEDDETIAFNLKFNFKNFRFAIFPKPLKISKEKNEAVE